jgi:DNA-binding NtrC family response regulator
MERVNLKDGLNRIVTELVRQGVTLAQARREFERQFIIASIESNDGNLCRSARSLGIHRNTLRNKVTDLGIDTSNLPHARSRRPGRRSSDARNPL